MDNETINYEKILSVLKESVLPFLVIFTLCLSALFISDYKFPQYSSNMSIICESPLQLSEYREFAKSVNPDSISVELSNPRETANSALLISCSADSGSEAENTCKLVNDSIELRKVKSFVTAENLRIDGLYRAEKSRLTKSLNDAILKKKIRDGVSEFDGILSRVFSRNDNLNKEIEASRIALLDLSYDRVKDINEIDYSSDKIHPIVASVPSAASKEKRFSGESIGLSFAISSTISILLAWLIVGLREERDEETRVCKELY